jgi:outer membrane protein assembly factor BamD (BamD/ComL family)
MSIFAEATRSAGRVAVAAVVVMAMGLHAQNQEDPARRRLESGRAFLKSQNYGEALKDFQVVLQSYPTTSVADDALLEIATYQLEIGGDARSADASVDSLLQRYPDSDAAPMGLVLKGRIALAGGYAPEQVNAALASFDRVPRLYPGTDAVPAAMYYAGETARLGSRRDLSMERFRMLTTQYPGSPWTPRAILGIAAAFVSSGQPFRAMEQLQRLRQTFPESPEAVTAIEWNTTLYRLFLRAPAQPPYVFNASVGGPDGRFRDVADIAVDRGGNLAVATKTGVVVVDGKGRVTRSIASQEPRALFFDRGGLAFTIHDGGGLRQEGKSSIVLSTTTSDGRLKPLRLEAGATMSNGDVLVADRDLKALVRFSAEGKPKGEFARQVVARRLAISLLDYVAALDTDSKTVALLNRDGKIVTRIPERGAGYQLRQPSDVAFDRLGHVYVLDRTGILIFSQQGPTLLASFVAPERGPGAVGSGEALALDAAARLFIFDGRSDVVQVYR